MSKRLTRVFITTVLLLLLTGWSSAPNQPANAQGQPAAFSPAFKTELPVDYTMDDYLAYVLNDVHAYWSPLMTGDGYPAPAVTYSFPGADEPIVTDCALPAPNDPLQAFYCGADDQIVITQEMALQLWNGTYKINYEPPVEYDAGDFSVAFVVAHEYAHNLQTELGWLPVTGDQKPITTSRSTELNADCLTGVWANSVYARGLLETTDIQEVMRTLADIGEDSSKLNKTHGTPKERTDAFLLGYNSGSAPSCDPYLNTPY
ncbi:neutral zinc metallopeptidase [Planococcus sp. APC 3906]|uniref:neutral zinc metallopeptidase n=1 Tax=Planococcus sp. APC 3906 TaxID=3035194 RepID=UPI0025B3962A|nr:neutral zinc metallopeptidase [Planococcus sp. APC 3906]MDN3450081.1 neutral zinc metallopeptidase [Planococcus sp. APC 3906]